MWFSLVLADRDKRIVFVLRLSFRYHSLFTSFPDPGLGHRPGGTHRPARMAGWSLFGMRSFQYLHFFWHPFLIYRINRFGTQDVSQMCPGIRYHFLVCPKPLDALIFGTHGPLFCVLTVCDPASRKKPLKLSAAFY